MDCRITESAAGRNYPGRKLGGERQVSVKMKNYFAVLNVDPGASGEEIRQAYRRRARDLHPDVEGGSEEDFRALQEAYDALRDQDRRDAYERDLRRAKEPSPFKRGRPIDLDRDFATHLPSYASLLDYLFDVHGGRRTKSGRAQDLRVEITLSPGEARAGGFLPLDVPVYEKCVSCEGEGEVLGFSCPACNGGGATLAKRTLPISIPPNLRDRAGFAYDLDAIGLPGTVLRVDFRVA